MGEWGGRGRLRMEEQDGGGGARSREAGTRKGWVKKVERVRRVGSAVAAKGEGARAETQALDARIERRLHNLFSLLAALRTPVEGGHTIGSAVATSFSCLLFSLARPCLSNVGINARTDQLFPNRRRTWQVHPRSIFSISIRSATTRSPDPPSTAAEENLENSNLPPSPPLFSRRRVGKQKNCAKMTSPLRACNLQSNKFDDHCTEFTLHEDLDGSGAVLTATLDNVSGSISGVSLSASGTAGLIPFTVPSSVTVRMRAIGACGWRLFLD